MDEEKPEQRTMETTMNYLHGGDVYRRRIDLDYSVNINPLGMPKSASEAAKHGVDESTAYPDWKVEELRDAVVSFINKKWSAENDSEVHADTNVRPATTSAGAGMDVASTRTNPMNIVQPEWITFGNGAADLIYRLMQVLRPARVLVTAPAFAEYSVAARRVGAELCPIHLSEADDFAFTDVVEEAFLRGIEAAPVGSAVFLCNPNNPDGNGIPSERLHRIAMACEERSLYLIVDECFLPFLRSDVTMAGTQESVVADQRISTGRGAVPAATTYSDEHAASMIPFLSDFEHLVVLRAFTKIYGMPGLRLGYMLTRAKELTASVQATMTPWEINLPAQRAGVAALQEENFVEKTCTVVHEERAFLVRVLPTLPYVEKVYAPESDANFILFRISGKLRRERAAERMEQEAKETSEHLSRESACPTEESVDLKALLLEEGVLIRACGNYDGLDDRYYRICVRTHAENLELVRRWQRLSGAQSVRTVRAFTQECSIMSALPEQVPTPAAPVHPLRTDRVSVSRKTEGRAHAIMVQGTMSNAGKSLLVAGLCRIFHEDGYRVAPFKAQNMALNSFITEDGLEMGRAQVVQAEAAGIAPDVRMNPILLKPTTDVGSQVIVRGVAQGNMTAREYYRNKKALLPMVRETYASLASEYDIIVIEGAGSPAEVNLREDDLVNMGMAAIADAPVLLVGDIDRGGVFAQLLGTIELLEPEERARIQGLLINKFRGDKTILDPGLEILEERSGKPVLGVVPYLDVALEDEDSLSTALEKQAASEGLDIAVIRLPRISNFTDFTALATEPNVSVRYVSSVHELGDPDVLILPGTKSTIRDLDWLRSTGLEAKILQKHAKGTWILGICGGFQMLGRDVIDLEGVEGPTGAHARGLGLLPIHTEFEAEKARTQTELTLEGLKGDFAALNGLQAIGYEIHMGRTTMERTGISCRYAQEANVFGTYVHGFFDQDRLRKSFIDEACRRKGIDPEGREVVNYEAFKEVQFQKLSQALRASLDLEKIYEMTFGKGSGKRA